MFRKIKLGTYILERRIKYFLRKDFSWPLENIKIKSTFVPDGRTYEDWVNNPPVDPMKERRINRIKELRKHGAFS